MVIALCKKLGGAGSQSFSAAFHHQTFPEHWVTICLKLLPTQSCSEGLQYRSCPLLTLSSPGAHRPSYMVLASSHLFPFTFSWGREWSQSSLLSQFLQQPSSHPTHTSSFTKKGHQTERRLSSFLEAGSGLANSFSEKKNGHIFLFCLSSVPLGTSQAKGNNLGD